VSAVESDLHDCFTHGAVLNGLCTDRRGIVYAAVVPNDFLDGLILWSSSGLVFKQKKRDYIICCFKNLG
jgi:hypothetical protein